MPGQRERLFVGVPLPDGLKAFVQGAQEQLPQTRGLRLLPEQQWHVTLVFLGEVASSVGETARRVVEKVSPDLGGDSRLGGFLMLPSQGKARVVTLAVQDDAGVFAALYEAVMTPLEAEGVMKREKRPYRPHLTVARMRVPGPVRPRSDVEPVRLAVESVCLYRSELRREGALYTVLARRVFDVQRRSEG